MENEIKKHIDRIKKKRIKERLDLLPENINENDRESCKTDYEAEYKYDIWLKKTLSVSSDNHYFPRTYNDVDLYDLLVLDISYKQSFKAMCDSDHSFASEVIWNLGLNKSDAENCIKKVKTYNTEPLEFYLLFTDEILKGDLSLRLVKTKIDELSVGSSQGCIISHAPKMTNPECRHPKIYSAGVKKADGLLRSGNSKVDFDMHINATKLKVFKFLSLKYKGNSLLHYIKTKNSSVIQKLFEVDNNKAEEWIESFLPCIENQDLRSNRFIRQAYFPVTDDYHLLSLLQPSGLIFRLKEKIDSMNGRSPASYLGKKNKEKGTFSASGFSTALNLTVTRHGGDHPKNISGLNNKHQTYYLLSSVPPHIEKRNIHFPKTNFFTDSMRYYDYRILFQSLHKLLKTNYNNINIREGVDYRLQEIVDHVIDKMWAVRSVSKEQYHPDYSHLKKHQVTWLVDEPTQEREDSDKWLDMLCKELSVWIIRSYEKALGRQAIKLGEDERKKVVHIINQNREALR